MLLADLIDGLDILYTRGNLDVDIEGIAYDSGKVRKGYLFVCIDGTKTDGHTYVKQALENRAAAFIAQRPLTLETEAPVINKKHEDRSGICIRQVFQTSVGQAQPGRHYGDKRQNDYMPYGKIHI